MTFFTFILCNFLVRTLQNFQKKFSSILPMKTLKNWASKVAHNGPQTSFHSKVWTFWEEHKIWRNLPLKIWHYWVTSNSKWKIFSNFVAFSEYPNFMKIQRYSDIGSAVLSLNTYQTVISSIFIIEYYAQKCQYILGFQISMQFATFPMTSYLLRNVALSHTDGWDTIFFIHIYLLET